MSIGGLQHPRVDGRGVDCPGNSGSCKCDGVTRRSGICVSLIVQEDKGEARSGNGDGAGVTGSVARDVHDVQFALETTIGFEVGTKSLASPCKVTLNGDVVGKEVFDPDGGRCAPRLAGLTTTDGDGNTQVVSARIIIQVVEECSFHGGTILVDSVTWSRRVSIVDAEFDNLRLVGPAENLRHGKGGVVHRTFGEINKNDGVWGVSHAHQQSTGGMRSGSKEGG